MIILTMIFLTILLFELLVLVAVLWVTVAERRRHRDPPGEAFEERSIVVPRAAGRRRPAMRPSRPGRAPLADRATRAYLAALDALDEDGRWPRRQNETPAAHLLRVRAEGLINPAFGRLAAAYQLARYGSRHLRHREEQRAEKRLDALRAWLRMSQNS